MLVIIHWIEYVRTFRFIVCCLLCSRAKVQGLGTCVLGCLIDLWCSVYCKPMDVAYYSRVLYGDFAIADASLLVFSGFVVIYSAIGSLTIQVERNA